MDVVTPEPQILYESLIEFSYGEWSIYYDIGGPRWFASHDDEERFDDDIIIQDSENLFPGEMELFDGFILKREEFDRLQEMAKVID